MKTQTTQRQLMALALKHRTHPLVAVLLASIKEAQVTVQSKHVQLESILMTKRKAVDFNNDTYVVMLSHNDLVLASHELAAAMTRIGHDLMALASVLQSLGVEIAY